MEEASSSLSEICSKCDLKSCDIYDIILKSKSDPLVLFNFLCNHNVLLRNFKCKKCNKDCVLYMRNKTFRCNKILSVNKRNKRTIRCNFQISMFNNSFFSQVKLPFWKVFQFVYLYLSLPVHGRSRYIIEDLEISSRAYVDWARFVREVCIDILIQHSHPIGGKGVIVEIDEAKFGHRKFNSEGIIEAQWVFGGLERINKNNQFFVPVPKRDKDTLISTLKKYVLPGSTIYGDCWKAYEGLQDVDFQHFVANHSLNFVDPAIGTRTQNIKRLWRDVRSNVPQYGRREAHYEGYLAEAQFRISFPKAGERFHEFWKGVALLYPPIQ